MPLGAIDEVFREVEAGAVHFGVVPVENSTEGMVNHTLDSFMNSDLKICGEVELRIHHHLLAGPHTRRDKVTRIYSHQQTLAQCRQWLDAHAGGGTRGGELQRGGRPAAQGRMERHGHRRRHGP